MTVGQSEILSPIVDRSVRLFQFLRELVSSRLASIRDLSEYEDVIWLSDIPRESGWFCSCWNVDPAEREQIGEDTWLRALKPKLPELPKPPKEIEGWINLTEVEDFRRTEPPSLVPHIYETVSEKNELGEIVERQITVNLTDRPDIVASHQKWAEEQWSPWAKATRDLLPVQEIYGKLFALYQKQRRLGESYEVVVGAGLFTWTPEGQTPIRRHVVTAQTEIAFEARRGVIQITSALEGARLTLEQDMLDVANRPDNDRDIVEALKVVDERWWDQNEIEPVLRSWTNYFSSEAQYQHILDRQSAQGGKPVVHFAPALILRKRTARTLIQVFESIADQLKESQEEDVPLGLQSVVTTLNAKSSVDEVELQGSDPGLNVTDEEEVYFPLPYNDKQRLIVEKFKSTHGVLVQGPPGTGKSQTIANLICHLLATGKRILVTSHTARALQSLSDKIPEEVRALCVSLMGNDRKALEGLERSIEGIMNRYNNWDRSANEKIIEERKAQLRKYRERQSKVLTDLRTVREAETADHSSPHGTYSGKLSKIALRLAADASQFGWVKPYLTEEQLPIPNTELEELRRLLAKEGDLQQHSLVVLPFSLQDLPSPARFDEYVQAEGKAGDNFNALRDLKQTRTFQKLNGLPREQFNRVAAKVRQIRSRLSKAKTHIYKWAEQVYVEVLGEKDRAWRLLLDETQACISRISNAASSCDRLKVTFTNKQDFTKALSDCKRVHALLDGGLKFKGLFGRPRAFKEFSSLLDETTVDGRPVDSIDVVKKLEDWLTIKCELESLATRWQKIVTIPIESISTAIAEFEDLCEPLRGAIELHEVMSVSRDELLEIGEIEIPVWYDLSDLERFCRALEAVELSIAQEEAATHFSALTSLIEQHYDGKMRPKIAMQILDAVQKRDCQEYRNLFIQVSQLLTSHKEYSKLNELAQIVEMFSPALLNALKEKPADPKWEECLPTFDQAWSWGLTDKWMCKLTDPQISEKLTRELNHIRDAISNFIKELAVARSWKHFFERLTEHERQNLIAWARNMSKVGKGTGKYAGKHREAARNNLTECRAAIPAWIMPIFRIAETLQPRPHSFDVVIIDEASQSGPEALFLEYIADKIIVVGDNKQISPDPVGVNLEEVNQLRTKYLFDLPHRENIGVEDSFFDLARIRFPGTIRLREHFRCMPEIIQFSNNHFYAGEPLEPLKQFTANRLDPVVCKYIDGGYEHGQKRVCNPVEADAVVQQIKQCIADNRYAGKTMGVISLLSTSSQANEIEKRLMETIGPEEMEKRQLICGDAYDFQGDERDIIFISMVVAPREASRIGALTGERYARPYNVATSRAREQMWLFHSVQPSDLSNQCYRHSLIQYCRNPHLEPGEFDRTKVFPDIRSEPFDSLFEQRVFLRIADRGFRVIPQYKVAGYNIDLVVEGMQGRLAVECDGDEWHGPDQYENDSVRQRQLQRCGWNFWRIRESTFNRDPEEAMLPLWAKLEQFGIRGSSIGDLDTRTARVSEPSQNREIPKADVPSSSYSEEPVQVTKPIDGRYFEEPYQDWKGSVLPDPRKASGPEIAKGLIDIVRVEGPIKSDYLMRLYIKGAGLGKLGHQIEAELLRVIDRAIKKGELTLDEENPEDKRANVLRVAGTPGLRLRSPGQRTLDDIPLREIAARS